MDYYINQFEIHSVDLLVTSMFTEFQAAVKLPNGITLYFNSLVGIRQRL